MMVSLGCAFSWGFYELAILCAEYLSEVVILVRTVFNYTAVMFHLPYLCKVISSRMLSALSIIMQNSISK